MVEWKETNRTRVGRVEAERGRNGERGGGTGGEERREERGGEER